VASSTRASNLQGRLLGEYSINAGQIRAVVECMWLDEQPLAAVRPRVGAAADAPNSEQEVFALHTDHLGTPRVALDTAGRLRWRWMGGEPFGVNPAENNPEGLGELNLSLRLPGQQYDGFVGLHYNYFRDYDPTAGRYVQSDPIGLDGGINTYAYVAGAPTMYSDPDGLQPVPMPPPILPPPVIPGPDYPYTPAPPSFTWPKLLPDSWVDKIIEMCSDTPEECRRKCDAANTEQVRICKMAPTKRAREACYSRANELYGQCLKKCK
jgi:RHS repeat-associated protein